MKNSEINLIICIYFIFVTLILSAFTYYLQVKTIQNLTSEANDWKNIAQNYSDRFDEAMVVIQQQNEQLNEYLVYEKLYKDLR